MIVDASRHQLLLNDCEHHFCFRWARALPGRLDVGSLPFREVVVTPSNHTDLPSFRWQIMQTWVEVVFQKMEGETMNPLKSACSRKKILLVNDDIKGSQSREQKHARFETSIHPITLKTTTNFKKRTMSSQAQTPNGIGPSLHRTPEETESTVTAFFKAC